MTHVQDGGWAGRARSGRPAHPLPALQRAHGQSNQHCTKPMNASPPFALLQHTSNCRLDEFRSPCNTLAYLSPDTLPQIHRGCAMGQTQIDPGDATPRHSFLRHSGLESTGVRVYPYPRVYPTRPVPTGMGLVG